MDNLNPGDRFAKIRVIGVGGGGCNAVSRMIEVGLRGVDFIVVNTDAQALLQSTVRHKIQIAEIFKSGLRVKYSYCRFFSERSRKSRNAEVYLPVENFTSEAPVLRNAGFIKF